MSNDSPWPVPKNRLLLGLWINVVILLVGVLAQFTYLRNVGYWETQIEQGGELIVFSSQMSSLCFFWVGLVPVLIIVNMHILFKDILKREIPKLVLKLQNFLLWVMFIGIALLIMGSLLLNPGWKSRFQDAGFIECQGVLNVRKAVFNDVWVRNPVSCDDAKLRYILHEHFGRRGFVLADQYLREYEKQSSSTSGDHPGPRL